MTVSELIEALEDYGGHLPVNVETHSEQQYEAADVDDYATPDGVVVVIRMGAKS